MRIAGIDIARQQERVQFGKSLFRMALHGA